MSRILVAVIVSLLVVFQAGAQNNYSGFYGEGGAGGIYTSVNSGPETGPVQAVISVARTNTSVYSISSTNLTSTNWLGVGGVATTFINPNFYYYFDPSTSGNTPSTQISNLYNTTLVRAWFSTNAAGIWFIRATNKVVVGSVTNVYRLQVSKTREQPPTLVSPNESSLNYIVYEKSDPQPYIGSANGDSLSFQWQKAAAPSGPWANISGATNPTATNDYFTVLNCSVSDAGYYRRYIYNSGGSVTSTWSQLTVNAGAPAWSFGILNAGLTNRAGYPGLISVGSSITPSVSINNSTKNWGYWRKGGVPTPVFSRAADGTVSFATALYQTNAAPLNGNGGNITAFNASYLLPTDSGNWDCVVFDAWGRSMTSSVYRIVVTNAPGGPAAIVRQPVDTTNVFNGSAAFTSGATGAAPVTVQWFRENGTPLIEATNYIRVTKTNLLLSYLQNSDATGYYMVATDLNGTAATSQVARLTIAQPPTFLLQPVDMVGTEGASATFNALGTCNVPFKYQWLFNGGIYDVNATNTAYTLTNLLATQNRSLVSVQLVSQYHTVVSTQAILSIVATGLVAKLQGQQWIKVLDTDSRVPGSVNLFSINAENIRGSWTAQSRPRMTLKDRTLHLTVPAGTYYYSNYIGGTAYTGYAPQSALVRWRSNQLDLLVFTNTVIPGTSDHFYTLFYPTDEEAGVMNFVGYGNTYRGVYGVRNGVVENAIPSLTTPYSDGPGFFDGSGQLVRRGTNLLFASNSTDKKPAGTNTQIGIFLWDGANFTTLVNENSDLPGAATGFQGVGVSGFTGDAFAYDGSNIVANIISYGTNSGVYLFNGNGVFKVADRTDTRPGFSTLLSGFSGVGLRDGRARFIALNSQAFAVNPQGALTNVAAGTVLAAPKSGQTVTMSSGNIRRVSEDGSSAYLLTSPPTWNIDGRRVQTVYNMVAEGDDIAIDVQFTDGSSGVFLSPQVTNSPAPGVPVTMSPVVLSGGLATFTFPTIAGRIYRIERSFGLPSWNYLTLVVGDGNIATVSTASQASGANYFRVIELP